MVGPRDSFGAVYAEILGQFGVQSSSEEFERSIYDVWDRMNQTVPEGENRYTHFEGGEIAYWTKFVKLTVEEATGEMLGHRLATEALKQLRERFGRADAWKVFDDVVPALRELREQGARLAVVSNWDSQLPTVLDRLELTSWFDEIVVSHFEGIEKPNPEIFKRALERMKVEPAEVLHVGDSHEFDGKGANSAGIDFVGIDRVSDEPEGSMLRTFSRLPEISRSGLASE